MLPGTFLGGRRPTTALYFRPYHITINPVLLGRTTTDSRAISIIS
jgi:hypothetical protein